MVEVERFRSTGFSLLALRAQRKPSYYMMLFFLSVSAFVSIPFYILQHPSKVAKPSGVAFTSSAS